MLEGVFTPSASASSISKAAHFQHRAVPITVRFSNFAGIPDIPDNHPLGNPRGLAIKFKLPNGSATDIVAHSFNGFPTPNANDFHDLIVALGASGPEAAKPTALDTYLAAHPVAKAFLTQQKTAPVSYATLPYYGVNTFKFIDARGKVTYGRYQFLPVAGEQSARSGRCGQGITRLPQHRDPAASPANAGEIQDGSADRRGERQAPRSIDRVAR